MLGFMALRVSCFQALFFFFFFSGFDGLMKHCLPQNCVFGALWQSLWVYSLVFVALWVCATCRRLRHKNKADLRPSLALIKRPYALKVVRSQHIHKHTCVHACMHGLWHAISSPPTGWRTASFPQCETRPKLGALNPKPLNPKTLKPLRP